MCNFVHTAMIDGGSADIKFLSVSLASMRRFCCGHKNIASTCFAAESPAWPTLFVAKSVEQFYTDSVSQRAHPSRIVSGPRCCLSMTKDQLQGRTGVQLLHALGEHEDAKQHATAAHELPHHATLQLGFIVLRNASESPQGINRIIPDMRMFSHHDYDTTISQYAMDNDN
jgi:hypothetical protein